MTLTKGNKAIANHAADGKDLLLFEMLGEGQLMSHSLHFRLSAGCPLERQKTTSSLAALEWLKPVAGA